MPSSSRTREERNRKREKNGPKETERQRGKEQKEAEEPQQVVKSRICGKAEANMLSKVFLTIHVSKDPSHLIWKEELSVSPYKTLG